MPNPPMDAFPPELLRECFTYLTPSEARQARLCCKRFALEGACHGFNRIIVSQCSADFVKLRAIADHPVISKVVKTLVYKTITIEEPAFPSILSITEIRLLIRTCSSIWLPVSALL
ncbi:hypothetical protein GGR56DRAFT_316430 [Xylariaceae sp. FL0804]|nr:hypothetical protein GGR56DRAFT_316430 [Xylariaceae sp. FL0804]